MKIAVLGAGGIGGFLGGALARSGEDVSFIARGNHLQAIRERGLTVNSVSLGRFQVKAIATDKPSDIGLVDLVLFCVKAYDTEPALQMVGPLVGDQTAVLSFQNGVENEDKIARALGKQHVLGGIISVESFIAEPGYIVQTAGPFAMAIGEMNGEITSRAKSVHECLTRAGLKVDLSTRIRELLWEKLLFIAPTAGMCSVSRAPIGDILGFEPTRRLYIAAMQEVEAVAKAKGVNLSSDIVMRTVAQADRINKSTKPSMLRDLERGKRLEVDALNGAVSRFGRELRIPTPVNDFISACLGIHELGARAKSVFP